MEARAMFSANEGTRDRAIRIGVGAVLLYLGWSGVVGGALGTAIGVLAFVPLITGLVGWCPLYRVLGISTNRHGRPARLS
jgi:hypothetical protein